MSTFPLNTRILLSLLPLHSAHTHQIMGQIIGGTFYLKISVKDPSLTLTPIIRLKGRSGGCYLWKVAPNLEDPLLWLWPPAIHPTLLWFLSGALYWSCTNLPASLRLTPAPCLHSMWA